jgi:hypothetical protein
VAPIHPVAAGSPLPVGAPYLSLPAVAGAEPLVPLALPTGAQPRDIGVPLPPGASQVVAEPEDVSRRDAVEPLVPADLDDADPVEPPLATPAAPPGQDLAGVIAMLDAQVNRGRGGETSPSPTSTPVASSTPTMLRPTLAASRRRGLGIGARVGEDRDDGARQPPTDPAPSLAAPSEPDTEPFPAPPSDSRDPVGPAHEHPAPQPVSPARLDRASQVPARGPSPVVAEQPGRTGTARPGPTTTEQPAVAHPAPEPV